MGKIPFVFPSHFRPLPTVLFQALRLGEGPRFVHLHGLERFARSVLGLALSWPLL